MRVCLETERLILRNLVPEDYEAVFRWCGDPDVARYMVYPVYTKAEDVRTWIESLDPDDPDEYDVGIVLKATGELIGGGGIFYRPERDLWTIGYNLRKDQWGNGYAVELIMVAENERAGALYRKCGFTECGRQYRGMKFDDGTYHDEILMVKML